MSGLGSNDREEIMILLESSEEVKRADTGADGVLKPDAVSGLAKEEEIQTRTQQNSVKIEQ